MAKRTVRIEVAEGLPEHVNVVAEGRPGRVRILVREGLNQGETISVLEDVWDCLVRLFPVKML